MLSNFTSFFAEKLNVLLKSKHMKYLVDGFLNVILKLLSELICNMYVVTSY